MRLFQPYIRQRRILGAVFAITFTVALLLTAFFHTQVLAGENYALRSEANRLRPIPIPAPRGAILDRNGDVVATSITGYSITLLPDDEESIRATLSDLAPFLGLSQPAIEDLMQRRARNPHDVLTVSDDATYSQVAALEERRVSFPNLIILERPKRYYPAGPAVAHLTGYVAEISQRELELPRFQEAGYDQGRMIGQSGIERQYELALGGQDGARFVEVDALGRIVDPRSSVGALPPTAGEDLQLTIDIGLQTYIHEIFPDTMKGAVVAMVPSTGEVLALYSYPAYDPNDFVGGISAGLWRALTSDPEKPLLNRATGALYPPASTWKLATAAMAVAEGIAQADTRMPIPCTGGMFYAGRYARCWEPEGHGSLDLANAIERSCNVYFYQLGIQLGLSRVTEAGTRIGFNTPTGIDLPSEMVGIFPTGPEWYEQRFGYEPTPSEVMSLAIGQGPNSQTVLRMAHFYSAIAGNGTAPEPYLVQHEDAGEGPGRIDLRLSPNELRNLWAGLVKVVQPGGTGWLSSLERWQIYGKTGTAENPHGADHGWFIGFSGPPGGYPEIVVAAIIEHGLHGSDVGPIVAKAIDYYLNKKYDHPFDPQPTLLERYQSGRKPWGTFDEYPAALTPVPRN